MQASAKYTRTIDALTLTSHATLRMAQRSIKLQDAELIALIGTEVEDGYLVRDKDYLLVEADLKRLLERLRRVVGKRLVVANGQIVTAYHATRSYQRRLLRRAHQLDFRK